MYDKVHIVNTNSTNNINSTNNTNGIISTSNINDINNTGNTNDINNKNDANSIDNARNISNNRNTVANRTTANSTAANNTTTNNATANNAITNSATSSDTVANRTTIDNIDVNNNLNKVNNVNKVNMKKNVFSKRSMILFTILLLFWFLVSETFDFEHLLIGVFLALITLLFWQDLYPRLPNMLSIRSFLHLCYCLILLSGYIIQSNIVVAKMLLFSDANKPLKPVLVEMETPITSNWGRVLLAICITITPGTITIDVDPGTGRFIVHALTEKMALDLFYWRLIHRIKDLETCE